MTGCAVQLVARLGLAILLLANGPVTVYVHAGLSECGCRVAAAQPESGGETSEAQPGPCGCGCVRQVECQEPCEPGGESSKGPLEERDSTALVEADCPCCPHCPAGCFICGACKPSSLHASPCFVLDLVCAGPCTAELRPSLPAPPASELLQVPKS